MELPDIPAAGPVGIEFVVKFDPLRGAGLGFDVDRIGQFVLQHQDRLRIEQAQLGADVKNRRQVMARSHQGVRQILALLDIEFVDAQAFGKPGKRPAT